MFCLVSWFFCTLTNTKILRIRNNPDQINTLFFYLKYCHNTSVLRFPFKRLLYFSILKGHKNVWDHNTCIERCCILYEAARPQISFKLFFFSTSPVKVWMWHEMRYRSRANWYLINVRPDWRAQAHLLCVSSNMHDLQVGFLPQHTFHAIRTISVRWCTLPAYRKSKHPAEILTKSWQLGFGLHHQTEHLNSFWPNLSEHL